ncbi:cobalt ABC transporter ATP-binding protein [Bacillus canaveralius]|uniref:Cobalt ABC transporter ATP-binding protein n=1 Tax=Bacillus canaveralius TaxID=1403243 RepID=A0A2N5GSJ3_9BACI|nr:MULTISPECIES: ABC transporter ATP-binding protein [Bacillus]PLR84884.1 cobalt ABC transporter ATP-binding protein [Bacillus sp. V33-4]PLR86742.1 cobalt ABC transporter ATP-binding protein [Bacillus canaveralius]PLR92796.1 cobalt ABC transporter ATP-binding protein [Bacillus canaveralius]RSK54666.1 ABC transporter ATP-binding protein [Bacillus canaveralius]
MNKIIVENLKYKYPLSATLALDTLSFEVAEGEFIGIIGANSAGKSTLCQSIVGLVPHFYKGAYGGKVSVDGLEVKNHSIDELSLKAGIVFQNPFTQVTGSKLTVYEEIAFGLENIGLSRVEMKERIDYVLDLLNIAQLKDRNPFELSGGQMQRMAIASIIAMKPGVIVLDEPTSQLDPEGSEEVFQAIQDLSKQGVTVILSEHKMEKIAQYCNRVMLLNCGKLIDFDTPEKVFSREDLEDYGVRAPVYTRVCKALNTKIAGTDLYPVTLDQAYMALGGKSR